VSADGGYQQLIRASLPWQVPQRIREPVPFEPNNRIASRNKLPDVAQYFARGHRIMVQVQSSLFPLTDRNPQKFLDIPKAKPEDFVKRRSNVFIGGVDGSKIEFLVVE